MINKTSALVIVVLCLLSVTPTHAQRRRQQAPRSSRVSADDSYLAAQRSIEAAIVNLERYVDSNPNAARAATARQQLDTLKSLSRAAVQPTWSTLNAGGSGMNNNLDTFAIYGRTYWRVTAIEATSEETRATIELRCSEDSSKCFLRPFDSYPLIIVDSAGEIYTMLKVGNMPTDVQSGRDNASQPVAVMVGGSRFTMDVVFAPLTRSASSGVVRYRRGMREEPAKITRVERR